MTPAAELQSSSKASPKQRSLCHQEPCDQYVCDRLYDLYDRAG